jgi:hypothetical protein
VENIVLVMKPTAYFASLTTNQFVLGRVDYDVFDVLPINTPIKIHQIICVNEDGKEFITDGDDLIQSKWELWQWFSLEHNVIHLEFSHPGGCVWTYHDGQLSIRCDHRGTLIWWTAELLKRYQLATVENFHCLAQSDGYKCVLFDTTSQVSINLNDFRGNLRIAWQ